MNRYMVIARVTGVDFLVKVYADSLLGAEHAILDLGICGRHAYGVEGAQAFDRKGMKTDTFIAMAMDSEPTELEDLKHRIEIRNEEIRQADEREERIEEIERQMKQLQKELEELKK